jgi:hypothetical protein
MTLTGTAAPSALGGQPAATPATGQPSVALQPTAPPAAEAARVQQLLKSALQGGKSSITATEGLLNIVRTPSGSASFARALGALRWGAILSLPFLLTGDSDPRIQQSARLEQDIKAGDVRGFFQDLAVFANEDPTRARSIEALGLLTQRLLDGGQVDSARRVLQEVIGALQKDFSIDGNPTDRAMDLIRDYLKPRAHPTEPVKPPAKPQAEPSPVPKDPASPQPPKPVELTQQQRSEAEAQGTFLAQIAFNKAANAGFNEVVDAYRQDYSRMGGLVSQLYHKVAAGEAGLSELKTVRNQLQTQWNQMSNAANALNRSNGAIDLLSRANSNAQALYKQWPSLQQDPNASAWLKTFASDLSSAKGWAGGLQGFLGLKNPADGLRGFITATDRYIQQAEAYRQGVGPKPVLPDFRPLTGSGLIDTPATRAAVKAMSDGYASASKWLSSWLPQRAQPKLAMPPSQFDVPGANGGWRAQALDGVPAGMKEVAKTCINVRTGEVSATPKTGPGWVEMAVHQTAQGGQRTQGPELSNERLAESLKQRQQEVGVEGVEGLDVTLEKQEEPPKKPPNGIGRGGGGWQPNPDNWWKWLLGLSAAGLALQAVGQAVQTVISLQSKETNEKSAAQQTRVYQLTERMTQADGMPIEVKPYSKATLDNVAKAYPSRADALIKVWQHYLSQAGDIVKSNPAVFGNDAKHHSDLARQFQVKSQQYVLDELSRLRKGIEVKTEAGQKEALGAMSAVSFPSGSDGLPALAVGSDVVEQRAINRIAQQLQQSARASLPSLGTFEQKVDQEKVNAVVDAASKKAGAGTAAPDSPSSSTSAPNTASPKPEPTPLPTPTLPPKAAQALSDARTQLTSLHGDALRLLFPSAVPAAFARAPSFPTTLKSLTAAGGTERQAMDRARPLFLEAGSNTSSAGTFYQRLYQDVAPTAKDLLARYPRDPQVQQLYRDMLALVEAATKLGVATDWIAETGAAANNGEPAAPQ